MPPDPSTNLQEHGKGAWVPRHLSLIILLFIGKMAFLPRCSYEIAPPGQQLSFCVKMSMCVLMNEGTYHF